MDNPDIQHLLIPRSSDLGDGFVVRRALPAAQKRMIGPFVFFDAFGPMQLGAGQNLDVRPHPHIGLATVTYLFDGEILHRDSLGNVQPIRPGAVNWMTAGRGIVHSERTPDILRTQEKPMAGIQTWVALPKAKEEIDPAFTHHAADVLPIIEDTGINMRVIIGNAFGKTAPVPTFSEMFYVDAQLSDGAKLELPAEHEERGAYISSGAVNIGQDRFESGRLIVFKPGAAVTLRAEGETRLLLLGGDAMDGHRHVWWNFVSSSRERIEQAKADWTAGRFGQVPGETEFIPLPEQKPPPVEYP